MHFLIAIITAFVGLVWVLDRLGINVGALNPFHWQRRKQWKQKFDAKPIHLLEKPIEAAAVLIISIVNAEGLVSREQKQEIMRVFVEELKQSPSDADGMFVSATFMLKDIFDIVPEIPHILAPNKELFTEEQSLSLIKMLREISSFDSNISSAQQNIIQAVERELIIEKTTPGSW